MNDIAKQIVNKIKELYGSSSFSIAFLPYKRSMWNSMSSVYDECKAAGAEVHCFPIPYYRMKEKRMIDYLDSDKEAFGDIAEDISKLPEVNPDFIVIHYPYDTHNRVTNMLPEYCTDALKAKYRAKIIYIPYGIAYGNFNTHFQIQPGIKNIDYAFLESKENMNRFILGWAEQGVDFSGRVFAYGSPKLDVAASAPKEIPEEWADRIGDRSITLVSTSLSCFLMDPFPCINSYKRNVREEIEANHFVIFRPHPLLKTTIRSMMPYMKQYYDNLLEEFSMMPEVIIDESEYLERAIGMADRLISDPSSVLKMWTATGRPYKVMNEKEG